MTQPRHSVFRKASLGGPGRPSPRTRWRGGSVSVMIGPDQPPVAGSHGFGIRTPMRFSSGKDFRNWPHKAVTVFGMSGVGKTTLARLLQEHHWFHYSVDYRIGTKYMDEHIVDNFKREAMKVPVPARSPALGFDLHPLQHHLRQPGAALDLSRQARQSGQGRHSLCRIQAPPEPAPRSRNPALQDVPNFIDRAREVYQYQHFICDSGGAVRGGRSPMIQTIRCFASTRRQHSAALYRRHAGTHRACWWSASASIPSRCTTNLHFLDAKWAEYKAHQQDQPTTTTSIRMALPSGASSSCCITAFRSTAQIARNFGYTVRMRDVPAVTTD